MSLGLAFYGGGFFGFGVFGKGFEVLVSVSWRRG